MKTLVAYFLIIILSFLCLFYFVRFAKKVNYKFMYKYQVEQTIKNMVKEGALK